MKWTDTQIAQLKQMCFDGTSNADLAAHFGVPVVEIHAKRSQHGITIPKIRAAQGRPAITVNPEFEAAVEEAEEKMGLKRGLSHNVKMAFRNLQNELLLAMAKNGTSIEQAKVYGCLAGTLTGIEEAFDRMIGDEA